MLGLIWGASFLSIRIALNEVGPMTVVLHRVFWAMLLLWTIAILRGETLPRRASSWASFLVMGCLNNVIPFVLMAWGQLHISSGLTSIFNATTAVFGVALAAMVFSDERLTLRKAMGVFLGFTGVSVAIGLENLTQFDITSTAQLAVIAGTFSYACAGAWARKRLSGHSPIVSAAGMVTGATIVMIPLTLITEGVPSLSLTIKAWTAIGYFSVIATALAYLLYYRILAVAGSGNVLLVTLIVPPIAIVLGTTVLHETISVQALVGFCIIALGLMVIDGRILTRLFRNV